MKVDQQRKLVDEINKKTILNKVRWGLISNTLKENPKKHPDAIVNYYYSAKVGDTTLHLYRTERLNQGDGHFFSFPSSAVERFMRAANQQKEENIFLVAYKNEDVVFTINSADTLRDLLSTVEGKVGTPDAAAAELLKTLEGM